ncbi:MAG: Holliday junction resolvase RuvX [candidate division Zixibacteria bacterium]|nr:Holliday junction resolvase RuvX [candidate division Zixibacteria bacterium]
MTSDFDREFIAIDYGSRRIGLAKSDPMGMIASPLKTLEVKSVKQALSDIVAVLEEYQPNGVVIGYPLLASGDRSPKCDEIDRFIAKLEEVYSGPIHKVDEHGTSVKAADIIHAHGKRVGKDKRRIDRLAAVIILERFLADTYGT